MQDEDTRKTNFLCLNFLQNVSCEINLLLRAKGPHYALSYNQVKERIMLFKPSK